MVRNQRIQRSCPPLTHFVGSRLEVVWLLQYAGFDWLSSATRLANLPSAWLTFRREWLRWPLLYEMNETGAHLSASAKIVAKFGLSWEPFA
jgi:hypothetical protein